MTVSHDDSTINIILCIIIIIIIIIIWKLIPVIYDSTNNKVLQYVAFSSSFSLEEHCNRIQLFLVHLPFYLDLFIYRCCLYAPYLQIHHPVSQLPALHFPRLIRKSVRGNASLHLHSRLQTNVLRAETLNKCPGSANPIQPLSRRYETSLRLATA